MKSKVVGSWIVLIGVILLAGSIYLYPPGSLPGSHGAPLSATNFQTSQQMMAMADNIDIPRDFYVETNSLSMATQATNNQITPMTFQHGTHYEKSYVFKEALTSSEYMALMSDNSIIGIWDVPSVMYEVPTLTNTPTDIDYGDMDDALASTHTDELIAMGYSGQNTIVVIIDDFPSESAFYDYIPSSWSSRIINYPSNPGNGEHGIMTAGVVLGVSPDTKVYLIEENGDPITCFQEVLNIQNDYPSCDIVSSNSYVYLGTVYSNSNHPINRKILEVTNNDITVLFGAGNWAHSGEHNPFWTLNVGYDSRSYMFERDSEIGYPAALDAVISVAACNAFGDKVLSYSSLGYTPKHRNEPDVCAPTHHQYPYSPYNGLTLGTSASTPFMAGICANILSGKTADNSRMVGSVHSYSIDRGYNGFDEEFGYGVADTIEIFGGYDLLLPSPETNPDLSMYALSVAMLGLGIVVYNKEGLAKIIGGR